MIPAEYVKLVIAVLATLTPVFARALWKVQRFQRGRRILQFSRDKSLDVVVTTSHVLDPGVGIIATRPLTGYGQVRAVASCTRGLTRLYPKKLLSLQISEKIRTPLNGDLVLLGGPLKNRWSGELLKRFDAYHRMDEFVFDDTGGNLRISVPGRGRFERSAFIPNQDPKDPRFPANDIGLIVIGTREGRGGRSFRAVLCAGFTTYGTAAAAEFLFNELVRMPRLEARRLAGVPLLRLRKDPIIVVEADIAEAEVVAVRPIAQFLVSRTKAPKTGPIEAAVG